MFPGLYYLLSFSKADRAAALAWQPVVLRANELERLELRDRWVPGGRRQDGVWPAPNREEQAVWMKLAKGSEEWGSEEDRSNGGATLALSSPLALVENPV